MQQLIKACNVYHPLLKPCLLHPLPHLFFCIIKACISSTIHVSLFLPKACCTWTMAPTTSQALNVMPICELQLVLSRTFSTIMLLMPVGGDAPHTNSSACAGRLGLVPATLCCSGASSTPTTSCVLLPLACANLPR